MPPAETPAISRIAFVSTYPPRRCGLATFTADLRAALEGEYPRVALPVVAVSDQPATYRYPPEVRIELIAPEHAAYARAAERLSAARPAVVSLQHEYGIFGGLAGGHVLELLRRLDAPVVTTLHTVLRDPQPDQRRVLEEVVTRSARLVVMSRRGAELLAAQYGAAPARIDLIPHGVPEPAGDDPAQAKQQLGLSDRLVLLTFGLLTPNKGIEDVIAALPAIVRRYPQVVYMILGATHPDERQLRGEGYRESLQRLAREQGVAAQVRFEDRYVSPDTLRRFISAADIYLTPYLSPDQIVSGTLAYALGAGKPIISTPYLYAQEVLADGRGVLVPPGSPAAIGAQVLALLDDPPARAALADRARRFGQELGWSRAARRYMASFIAADR